MNIPSLGGLPALPSAAGEGSSLADFGSALSQLPQQMDQQAMESLYNQNQKQQLGQSLFATLAQRVHSDPMAQIDPSIVRQADMIARQSGMPSVTMRGPDGRERINVDALSPKKQIANLDPKTISDLRGLDPAIRRGQAEAMGIDVDAPTSQAFLSAKASVSDNPALIMKAAAEKDKLLTQWQSGLMDPQAYAAGIKTTPGLSAEDVAQLTDPTLLSAGISKMADAKIAAIPAAIAAKLDMVSLHKRMEDDAMTRFNQTLGVKQSEFAQTLDLNKDKLAERQRMDSARIQQMRTAGANGALQAQKLGLQVNLLQEQLKKGAVATQSTAAALGVRVQKQATDLHKTIGDLESKVASAVNNGTDPADPQVKAMYEQIDALKKAAITADGLAATAQAQTSNAMGNLYQGINGGQAQQAGGSGPRVVTGTTDAMALPVGATFTFKGKQYKRVAGGFQPA